MVDGFDPRGEQPVERRHIGGRSGFDLDEELDAHRLENSFDLAAALRSSGFGVHEAHAEAGARPQELFGDVSGPVIDIVGSLVILSSWARCSG